MEHFVESSRKSITDVELKQLLVALSDATHMSIRYRVIGEMWGNYFLQVTSVDESNTVFFDELNNKYHAIDFRKIIQFELDSRYRSLQPNFHYDVICTFEMGF
jgi:hypothetical protein